MHRILTGAFAGLCLLAVAGGNAAARDKPVATPPPSDGACGSHGTSVEFYDTPSAAAAKAKKEQKLVFVLHVSGNFEDPRFT